LLAVIIATVVSALAGWDVATIGTLPSQVLTPRLPSFAFGDLSQYLGAAFAVAALAAIESLLSARVADGMTDRPPHNPDRELVGQGLANIAAPLLGGMPATGAIARTAVNVRAGARTRVAAIVHSFALVVVVVAASGLVARIPLAALAGVLMVTAARMVETHNIRAILRSTRSDALVLVLTAVATVAFDLIVAVEIGVAVAAVLALRNVARTTAFTETPVVFEVDDAAEHDLLREHIVAYRIDGALFFGAAQRFLTDLAQVADVRVVILRLPDLQVLDATGAQALGEIVADLERRHITVLLKGPRPEHERVLRAVGALDHLATEHHIFSRLDDAIAHAHLHAARTPHDPDGCQPAAA
jgi:SulP family sulfate permease